MRILAAVVLLVIIVTVAVLVGVGGSDDDEVDVASPLADEVAGFCPDALPELVDAWQVVRGDGDLVVTANLDEVLALVESDVSPLLSRLSGEGVDPATVERIADLAAAARGTLTAGQPARTAELVEALRLELRLVLADPDLPGGAACDPTAL